MDDLFFIASKLVWGVLQPSTWLLIAASAGFLALLLKWRRIALAASGFSLAFVLTFTFLPVGDLLMSSLEQRWPRPEEPAQITGIIVLGGAEEGVFLARTAPVRLNEGGERFIEGLRLAMDHPEAKLVFSGGAASLSGARRGVSAGTEHVAERFYRDLGIDPARLTVEPDSRNTAENARFSYEMLRPKPGETWLLVTSAFHMERSMRSFEAAGWTGITAWPVDFRTWKPDLRAQDFERNLRMTTIALKEYVGLLAYALFKP